jgi:hypothetical protein
MDARVCYAIRNASKGFFLGRALEWYRFRFRVDCWRQYIYHTWKYTGIPINTVRYVWTCLWAAVYRVKIDKLAGLLRPNSSGFNTLGTMEMLKHDGSISRNPHHPVSSQILKGSAMQIGRLQLTFSTASTPHTLDSPGFPLAHSTDHVRESSETLDGGGGALARNLVR